MAMSTIITITTITIIITTAVMLMIIMLMIIIMGRARPIGTITAAALPAWMLRA